jgi:hypothetical protein
VHTGFWWRNLRERNHLENFGVDGTIILKCIFKYWDGLTDWIGIRGSGWGQFAGCCECGNEYSGYIICEEYLEAEDLSTFKEGLCCMEFLVR